MADYDVVVIGGGINGLTVAAYLARAGLRVAVFEARGQCGAHCDTVELGLPGFLHNTHAAWLVPALSPAMTDLELERHGLELRGTDVLFAKLFRDGRAVVQALDQAVTRASLARFSERDAGLQARIADDLAAHAEEALEIQRALLFRPPDPSLTERVARFHDGLLRRLGLPLRGDDVQRMSGLDVLEHLFESEPVRTLPASLGEFTGQWPIYRGLGPQALALASLAPMPVHTARGGSHSLTHALVRALVAHGGEIWTTCFVERIVVRDGRARGIRIAPDGLLPEEEIGARVVVSNLTLAPTFLELLGEEVIGGEKAELVRRFAYDDPQLLGIYLALRDDPEFAAARWEPAVQRAWVGYFGGDSIAEMRAAFTEILSGVQPDRVMGGWFIPTRADPAQAPPGCHTAYLWVSVHPCPRRWRGRELAGWKAWPELTRPLAEAVLAEFETCAPGFRDLVLEWHTNSPLDQERNNPSAVRGNMIGGSARPAQYGANRPLPGIVQGGASRTFLPGLYLSNSIYPFGATHLATGYIAACEIAADLGCRDAPWWRARPYDWFLENLGRIPLNLGVSPRWQAAAQGVSHEQARPV